MFAKAMEIAQTLELAEKNAEGYETNVSMGKVQGPAQKLVKAVLNAKTKPCYCCGNEGHAPGNAVKRTMSATCML